MKFNVYSAKLKVINQDGRVKSGMSFIYKKTIPTYNGDQSVCDPQIIEARDTKALSRKVLNLLKYRAKAKESLVLQIKTTKGQIYFSNMGNK